MFYETQVNTQTSRVSYRKVVKMERNEVVELMNNTIQGWNRQIAKEQQMPEEVIEKWISESAEQLNFVNGMLYDTLKGNGVIR